MIVYNSCATSLPDVRRALSPCALPISALPISAQLFISLNNISNILRDLYGEPRHNNRKCGRQCASRSVPCAMNHTALSDQAQPPPYLLHAAYYSKDREGQRYGTIQLYQSRPKVWYQPTAPTRGSRVEWAATRHQFGCSTATPNHRPRHSTQRSCIDQGQGIGTGPGIWWRRTVSCTCTRWCWHLPCSLSGCPHRP